jgi:spore coat-associated protein N
LPRAALAPAALSQITLTTAATASSLLDTDPTNGLQLTVQSCPSAWTEAGTAPGYTYTCAGATTLIASRPVVGSNVVLTGSSALAAGASDNLLVRLSFPTGADNTFQGKTSTVGFTFTGTQRAATDR